MSSSQNRPSSPLREKNTEKQATELKQLLGTLNGVTGEAPANPVTEMLQRITSYWWVGLLAGIAWTVIALVILKSTTPRHDRRDPHRHHVPRLRSRGIPAGRDQPARALAVGSSASC
jgi:hypothetical protein